ncbi:hypothetical protein FKG94_01085 [Exilibacterium tricleocarpae]|uniref:Uncharacterized protein n=1 Tax=Exilibacterium tricleocarpae TaxID=2591008 RepID=A0A545U9S2_9GAMM|nr:hypothetical protein [Exilibacterium tricleocarpae]TQV86179.1 hypothetical protein FKG94_01085 [Exilibacterium tricleocarpae]
MEKAPAARKSARETIQKVRKRYDGVVKVDATCNVSAALAKLDNYTKMVDEADGAAGTTPTKNTGGKYASEQAEHQKNLPGHMSSSAKLDVGSIKFSLKSMAKQLDKAKHEDSYERLYF